MNKDYANAISRIAWAYFITTFHLNLGTVKILPGFVGYILMYIALEQVGKHQASALLLKPLVAGLIGTGLVDWVLAIFSTGINNYIYAVVECSIYLYVHFQLMTDIYHTIEDYNLDSGGAIPALRNITTITYTIWFICQFFAGSTVVLYAAAIVNIVMKTCLMASLWAHSGYVKEFVASATEKKAGD